VKRQHHGHSHASQSQRRNPRLALALAVLLLGACSEPAELDPARARVPALSGVWQSGDLTDRPPVLVLAEDLTFQARDLPLRCLLPPELWLPVAAPADEPAHPTGPTRHQERRSPDSPVSGSGRWGLQGQGARRRLLLRFERSSTPIGSMPCLFELRREGERLVLALPVPGPGGDDLILYHQEQP
jgi:hypothetical protein